MLTPVVPSLIFFYLAPVPLLSPSKNLKSLSVTFPNRYEGLGVKEIRTYLDEQHPEVYAYLPEPSLELPKTPKQWIANVCATVLHDEFSKWVKDQVEARHDKVSVKKNIMIQMDPEMERIFRQSTAVSSKCTQSPLNN